MSDLRPGHVRIGGRDTAAALLGGLLALAPSVLRGDTLVLRDGDRVTGKIVAKGTRRIRLQTPYGLLTIPRERIEKIVHEDGSEEPLNAPAPTPPPSPPPPPRLVLVVTGSTFWQAWDPKTGAPVDPSIRLEVRLDGKPVAQFVDPVLDPEDLPGAVVNSFSFAPDALRVMGASGVELTPPRIDGGRIRLEIGLPPAQAGPHELQVAYQVNDALGAEPGWRDLLVATADIRLQGGAPAVVQLQQDRGRMEFSKHRMRNAETFRMVATPE